MRSAPYKLARRPGWQTFGLAAASCVTECPPASTATLTYGQRLTALAPKGAPDAGGVAWQNVRTEANQTGWAAAEFLSATSPVTVTSTVTTTAVPAGTVAVNVTAVLQQRINEQDKEHMQVRGLFSVGRAINSTLEIDTLLSLLIETIIGVTGAERTFLMLMDQETQQLSIKVARGIDPAALANADFQISRGIADRVAKEHTPVLTTNAQEDTRFQHRESVKRIGDYSIVREIGAGATSNVFLGIHVKTLAAAAIKRGRQERLSLGNLDAKRDWGYAGDYVELMWMMLQQTEPDDYVIATGETHSVREFAERAFSRLDMKLQWQGSGVHEKGIDAKTGKIVIEIDPKYFRPAEVDLLLGDPTKAKERLNWKPQTDFEALVNMMVDADLQEAEREKRANG